MLNKNIKKITAISMLALSIGVSSASASTTERCLKGKEPTQQETFDAERIYIEKSREFNHLFLLSKMGDKNAKKEYDEAVDLAIKNISTAMKIYEETILPPLISCSESTISLDELKWLLGSWYYLNKSEPLNRGYIYNVKLLTRLNIAKNEVDGLANEIAEKLASNANLSEEAKAYGKKLAEKTYFPEKNTDHPDSKKSATNQKPIKFSREWLESLSIEEMKEIDFSQVDFSEFKDSLMPKLITTAAPSFRIGGLSTHAKDNLNQ